MTGNRKDSNYTELARAISRGELECDVLARQPRRVTVRARAGTESLIVKLWNLRDPRGIARRMLRQTKGRGEWTSLRLLEDSGVPVPKAVAFMRLCGAGVRHQEALVVEDLAPCTSLHTHIHALSKQGANTEVDRLGGEALRITAAMIDAGLLDNDHRLGNFVVRSDGSVFRLDFENARVGLRGVRREDALGVMVGALVASHAWATRCRPDDAVRFVERLVREIALPERTRARARDAVAKELQRRQKGTSFNLNANLGL